MWIGNWTLEDDAPVIDGNVVHRAAGTGIASHTIGGSFTNNICEDNLGAGIKNVPKPGTSVSTLIDRNQFRRNLYNGLQVDLGHHMTISNNTIEENDGQGISMYSDIPTAPLRDLVISNNIIRNNNRADAASWGACGILIHDGGINIAIRDNTIEDTRSAPRQRTAIWLNNSRGAVNGITIERNSCRGHRLSGMIIGGGPNAIQNLTLRSNSCTDNKEFGLFFTKAAATFSQISLCGNDLSRNVNGPIANDTGLTLANPACANGDTVGPGAPTNFR